jgi:hypothetical protein
MMVSEDANFMQPLVKASGILLKLSSVVLSDVLNCLCLWVQIVGAASGFFSGMFSDSLQASLYPNV